MKTTLMALVFAVSTAALTSTAFAQDNAAPAAPSEQPAASQPAQNEKPAKAEKKHHGKKHKKSSDKTSSLTKGATSKTQVKN